MASSAVPTVSPFDPPPEIVEVEVQAKLSELVCHLQIAPFEHSNVSARDARRSQVPCEKVGPFEREPSAVEVDCDVTREVAIDSKAPIRRKERILRDESVVLGGV